MAFHKGKTEAGRGPNDPPPREFKAQRSKVRRVEGKAIVLRALVEHAGTERH